MSAAETGPNIELLKMTEEEYKEFLRQRDQFRALLWFHWRCPYDGVSLLQMLRSRETKAPYPYCFVELPNRLIAFSHIGVTVDFSEHERKAYLHSLPEAFPHFPEITSLTFESLGERGELTLLLRTASKLPHLGSIHFRVANYWEKKEKVATLSKDQIVSLSKCSSVRHLSFWHCRILSKDVPLLVKLTNLEGLGVDEASHITPECFITLSQLPRFRSFSLQGNGDSNVFNVSIKDKTRRAIESLDGRLEVFIADEIGTTIHPSVVRALLKVKSLKELVIDQIGPSLTLADVKQLENLTNLTRLGFSVPPRNQGMSEEERAQAEAIITKIRIRLGTKGGTKGGQSPRGAATPQVGQCGKGDRSNLPGSQGPLGQVAPGDCSPGAPTDPDVQDYRIRFLK